MSDTESTSKNKQTSPALWDEETLLENWRFHLKTLAEEKDAPLPLKRLQLQAEMDPECRQLIESWSGLDGPARLESWKRLLTNCDRLQRERLPMCVQCGACCQQGSPTLKLDDLEILREEKIPWDQLITLRAGEAVHSSITQQAFYLPNERIKIREVPGTKQCVFYDEANQACRIYAERPMQCRAQACWNPQRAVALSDEADLNRSDIFANVEVLMELLEEHNRRCSFGRLQEVFETLKASEGTEVDEVIELLSYDDHYRQFVAEKLNLPEDTLDLVFGRSLASQVKLFGFQVETADDGTRTLKPLP